MGKKTWDKVLTKKFLSEQLFEDKTAYRIAKEVGASQGTVKRYILKYNLEDSKRENTSQIDLLTKIIKKEIEKTLNEKKPIKKKTKETSKEEMTPKTQNDDWNLFNKMKFKETAEMRKARKFDEVVARQHEPTPRDRGPALVEVNCEVCGKKRIVSPTLVRRDRKTKELKYRCDHCLPGSSRDLNARR